MNLQGKALYPTLHSMVGGQLFVGIKVFPFWFHDFIASMSCASFQSNKGTCQEKHALSLGVFDI